MKEIARRAALPLAALAIVALAACAGDVTASDSADLSPATPSRYIGAPTPPPPPPPPPPPVPEDSVVGGYGSNPTGGIEYEPFEYEPETGTEYVATPDTTPTTKALQPTTTKP